MHHLTILISLSGTVFYQRIEYQLVDLYVPTASEKFSRRRRCYLYSFNPVVNQINSKNSPLGSAFLLGRDAATKTEPLNRSWAHMKWIGCPRLIVCNRVALTKSQINILPSNVPATSWKEFCGLMIAEVRTSERSVCSLDGGADNVETTSPVTAE